MALSATLEAMMVELEKVDPVAGKAQRELLEKHPSLQKPTEEQRLRQADYDRKHNADKEKIEYGTTMKKWADENIPKYDEMKATAAEAEKQRDIALAAQKKAEAALQEKITKAATESGVDPDKLADAVRAKMGGEFLTKTEFTSLVNAEATKLVNGGLETAVKKFYDTDVPRLTGLNVALTEGINRFHDEFKEHLDPEAYLAHLSAATGEKFMTDGKFDRKKVYDAFVAQKRSEVSRASEIEKEAQKRADKILEERGQQGGFPGTSGPAGPLQVRFNAKDKNDPLFGAPVELGDGSAAAAAAAELHSEGR
jgi:hypothetical protein